MIAWTDEDVKIAWRNAVGAKYPGSDPTKMRVARIHQETNTADVVAIVKTGRPDDPHLIETSILLFRVNKKEN